MFNSKGCGKVLVSLDIRSEDGQFSIETETHSLASFDGMIFVKDKLLIHVLSVQVKTKLIHPFVNF